MIDIVLVSSDEVRLSEVAGLLSESGIGHRLVTLQGGVQQLLAREDTLAEADLLIFDGNSLTPEQIDPLADVLGRYKDMTCMLLAHSPSADLLIRAMRAGIRDVVTWPLDKKSFLDGLGKIVRERASTSTPEREGKTVSFVSCKGGSGTTFIAANAAYALATLTDKRVLLVDLNLEFGDAAFLVCDKVPPATLTDVCLQINRLDVAFLEACLTHVCPGFDVLAGSGDPLKVNEVKAVHVERILALVRQHYDVVIFDVGHVVSPIPVFALDHSELIYPVLQPTIPYVRGGRRLLDIFRSLGYSNDKIRLLLNRYDTRGAVTQSELEDTLGLKVALTIAEDTSVVVNSVNQGVPLLQLAKKSPAARGLVELAFDLTRSSKPPETGFLQRLFRKRTLAKP